MPDWRYAATAFLVAFQITFVLWLVIDPAGDSALLWIDDISTAVAPFIAGVVCLAVALRYHGSQNTLAWGLIALGLFLFAFGDGSWAFQEIVLDKEVPFPSISDAGYLSAYVPVFVGLLLMPQAPANGLRRVKMSLDVLIGIGAVAVVSWNFVVSPIVQDTTGSLLGDSISVAYPLLDLAIIFAVLVLLVRATPGDAMAPLLLIGASFAVTAFSDSLYTYLTSVGGYDTGSYIDIGWVLGYNLLTIGGLLCLGRPHLVHRPRDEDTPSSFWQSAAVYSAVLPMGALLFVDSGSALTAGVFFVIVIAFVRQLVTVHENLKLNRKLATLTAELESKVREQTMALLRARSGTESHL